MPPRSPYLNSIEHLWNFLEQGGEGHHTAPYVAHLVTRGDIESHCSTFLVRIAGTLNTQCLPSALFQYDNARPHLTRNVQEFFFTLQIELLHCPACSPDLSPIENVWSMLAQRLTWDILPAATQEKLGQYVEAAWTTVPQGYI
ncbi:transposable element Tcb1 transposase [Trichonephila clavipes]|nr:transposable element Tcb1 transposase [Trichonephila clavipes]